MRILITGGAGFIGSHLSDHLLKEGHEVTIIDDLSTGSILNIRHLKSNPKFHYYIDTITNEPMLAEYIDEADMVFHLAAAVGVNLIIEDPVRTIETNIGCTEKVLKNCAKKKKRLLITSTSEVYGKNTNEEFKEDDDLIFGNTTKSRWSYAASKAIDEFLALAYVKKYNLPTTVVRLFNTVGPRQTGQYGMVIPGMIECGIKNQQIKVFGDGTQSRCFCHVKDVVVALAKLIQSENTIGEVYNIGSQHEISIMSLAEIIKTKLEAKNFPSITIKKIPYSEAYEPGFEDMLHRKPNLEKTKNAIGFNPKRTLDQILDDVIEEKMAALS
ncbi:MAG: nucleoside-diphosphate sugar epimerase [Planctomycetota bacterium]|nr:MAG: nucleoside-diphosphate sugar epimerase [Planctomycetota bacterium]